MSAQPARLRDLCKVIRSKNAGPFELTLDLLFERDGDFVRAQGSSALTRATIARLYDVDPADILGIIAYPPARAIKITLKRKLASGTFGDTDVYGAQQHAPLLDLLID